MKLPYQLAAIAVGAFLLQSLPSSAQVLTYTYHERRLSTVDSSGKIGGDVTIPMPQQVTGDLAHQPTSGDHYSRYYDTNTVGSWTLNAPTSVTVDVNNLTVSMLHEFSFDVWSETAGSWTFKIAGENGAGTPFLLTSAAVTTAGGSAWQTITGSSLAFTSGSTSLPNWWEARFASYVGDPPFIGTDSVITSITVEGPSGHRLANIALYNGPIFGVEGPWYANVYVLSAVPSPDVVPEPGSVAMLLGGAGILLMSGYRRMKRRRA